MSRPKNPHKDSKQLASQGSSGGKSPPVPKQGTRHDAHTQETHEQIVELPPQPQEELRTLIAMKASKWSGPLPHPEFAREYEALCPGALDRLLTMVEKQSEHRQEMERQSVKAQVDDLSADRLERKRGQVFGLVIALAFILVGAAATIFAGTMAGQIVGAVLGGTGAIGLVSLFVIGKDKKEAVPTPRRNDRQDDDE